MVERDLHREMAHVHHHAKTDGSTQPDYSLHMTLASKDCELAVVRSGFSQRSLIAGKPYNRFSSDYMLVDAPRTLEDVPVVMQLVRASIGYFWHVEGRSKCTMKIAYTKSLTTAKNNRRKWLKSGYTDMAFNALL